jgi:hypothetical protein
MSTDPTDDPIAMLAEIAQIAMDRMNDEHPVGAREAFALGAIAGIAARRPEVSARLREKENEKEKEKEENERRARAHQPR